MKENRHTPTDTLTRISRRVPGVSSDFETQKNSIRNRLRSEVRSARIHPEEKTKDTDFGSAWLPGPLSYPWLLMFAGVPKVIEHLMQHT